MKNDKIKEYILSLALLVMLIMAAMPLFNINEEWMRWVYASAAAVVLLVRLTQRYKGSNLRIKRLYMQNIVAALLFCASALLTFYSKGTNDWIAFLMAGSVLQIYVAFMLDKLNGKEHS